jgi:hypothetical protein
MALKGTWPYGVQNAVFATAHLSGKIGALATFRLMERISAFHPKRELGSLKESSGTFQI